MVGQTYFLEHFKYIIISLCFFIFLLHIESIYDCPFIFTNEIDTSEVDIDNEFKNIIEFSDYENSDNEEINIDDI